MTHFSKCDIFNQFYSFKVRLSERIQFAGLKYARVFFLLFFHEHLHTNEYIKFKIRTGTKVHSARPFSLPCSLLCHSEAFTCNCLGKMIHIFSSGEPDSPYTNCSEFAKTKIQCNAFINRWNIANFPKKIEAEKQKKRRANEREKLRRKALWRRTHIHSRNMYLLRENHKF